MSDEMSSDPVAWMTPGGDVSRSLEWCKERCWPEGEQPTPLYSQSPAEARALAIAECARVCEKLWEDAMKEADASDVKSWANEGARLRYRAAGLHAGLDAIRALSPPPSVSEEWVRQIVLGANGGVETLEDANCRNAVRATLAALGVEVK